MKGMIRFMMHYTHTPGGIFAVAAYYSFFPPTDIVAMGIGLAAGGIGGLLPDIDHSGSKIAKKMGLLGKGLSRILKHRGISHTPMLWTLLFAPLLYYFPLYQFIFLPMYLGTLSHIFLDALTPMGVPLLGPFSMKKIRFLKIPTGGTIEWVISGLLQVSIVLMVILLIRQGF